MDSKFVNNLPAGKTLEKYSSAFTLSDMEIFIFPDLLYPLIIASIMSPIVWEWRDDPWFKDIEKKSFTYRANRIKQFIIQNYVFNLDLETWGLTTRSAEIARFRDYFDIELLKKSNALFGYEGDKYYFDIDIRKHFGLDKYDSDIIPYWKTETVEAMTAFKFRKNFSTGAGECVSLTALYAAVMFVVGRVPLEKIFLMATPLHSQNFIIEKEGLITNNRRIVTKNMWYNGTSLSKKARRALEHEKVIIVSHITGYIHTIYNEATISREAYDIFSTKLKEYLVTDLTSLIFVNFLRFKSKYKSLFQYRYEDTGRIRYISLEKMFEYEHTSKFNASPETRTSLLKEIEEDEFHLSPLQGKIILNDVEEVINRNYGKTLNEIENELIKITWDTPIDYIHKLFRELNDFISVKPRIPDDTKVYLNGPGLIIPNDASREKIFDIVLNQSEVSEISALSLYVYRQMDKIDWLPFIKAAIERNPVCLPTMTVKTAEQVYGIIKDMPDESIYDGNRLSLPDEVWNFNRGDGVEKAFLLADILINKDASLNISLILDNKNVILKAAGKEFHFTSDKKFRKTISIGWKDYKIT